MWWRNHLSIIASFTVILTAILIQTCGPNFDDSVLSACAEETTGRHKD